MKTAKAAAAISAVWIAAAALAGLATGNIGVGLTGRSPHRTRWAWPWLHWCMFDRQCRKYDCPKRLYVHVFGLYIDFFEKESE